MRPTMLLRAANNMKPSSRKFKIPYEVWPLFAGMGFVCVFATYRITSNLRAPEVRKTRSGQNIVREPEIVEGEHH